jgi:hypothetical protein
MSRRAWLIVLGVTVVVAGAVASVVVLSSPVDRQSDRASEVVPWVRTNRPTAVQGTGRPIPLDRVPVAVTLLLSEPVHEGERYRFVVRLANRGGREIALNPCPDYRVQMMKVVETGFLNCAVAPAVIPPREHLDFAMEIATQTGFGLWTDLLWQLGGEGREGATATARVTIAGDR